MALMHADDEAVGLQVAIDLLERSDAYAATDPRLSHQYARQAYEMGQISPGLRKSIARKRIGMIVQHSDQRRIMDILATLPSSEGGRVRHLKKAGLMLFLLLAALLLHSTPIDELPDQGVKLATRFIDAPL